MMINSSPTLRSVRSASWLLPLLLCSIFTGGVTTNAVSAADHKLLFLGDQGGHRPAERFAQLAPVLRERGIELKYTEDVNHLHPEMLKDFDGLVLYANIDRITPDQADALLQFVEQGKGFVPLHSATFCFRNDPRIVALMGGQFLKHGGEVFTTIISEPDHPIMRGFSGFESWDETYVHHLHNPENRTVLEVRKQGMQADGNEVEPWTWVRTQGQGRIFYTAWGHDHRTWGHPGFQNLVERGIRWACGGDPSLAGPYRDPQRFDTPAMTKLPADKPPFEYVEVGAKIPNYVPSRAWGTQADPLTSMQLPLPAEQSIQRYVTPQGFQLEIYATEDFHGQNKSATESPQRPSYAGLQGKPIGMNWDADGRLWVCETIDYPNELQPRNRGRDRIRVCTDTTGDGQADTFTVFAENLSIPTTLAFHRGGVVVQNGSETLWLKDTTGDGRADQREVLISNWDLRDTHGGVSNFRYGIDNWFWGMQGYNASEPIITATGEKQQGFRMGFWRFQLDDSDPPQVTRLEFIRSTNNNTWGLGISEEGIVFGSTANHNPSVYMPIPNRYYERVRGWGPQQLGTIADTHLFSPISDRIRQVDHHGGYTAAAGHALYTARNYPQQWWNRTAFVCGPTGKLVGTFVISPQGTDFTSHSPLNLVASDDEWAAPIAAEVGPDGNVWVLDWYNYIIQHNPTPRGFETGKGNAYESDLRDKKHGRIYRVIHESHPESDFPKLSQATPAELVQALSNPTKLVRLHAQRLLVERGQLDVVPQLMDLVRRQQLDDIGLDVAAMHALATLDGLGLFSKTGSDTSDVSIQDVEEVLKEALQHPASGVRRIAVGLIVEQPHAAEWIAELGLLQDAEPQVQLATLLALADLPTAAVAEAAATAPPFVGSVTGRLLARQFLNRATMEDTWLADAVTSAAAQHALVFFQSLTGAAGPSTRERILLSEGQSERLRIVAEHFSRGRPSAAEVQILVAALNVGQEPVVVAILDGVARSWPRDYRITLSEELDQQFVKLLEKLPTTAKGRVIQLGTQLGSQQMKSQAQEIAKSLLKVVSDQQQSIDARTNTAQQLVEFLSNDENVVRQLVELVGPQTEPQLAEGLLQALLGSSAENLAEVLIERSRSLTPVARQAAIRVLLTRPATTQEFLKAVSAGRMQLGDLSLDQKQALAAHPDRRIRTQAQELLKAGGGLPNPDRQRVVEEFLAVTESQGDLEVGKAMFVKHCAKCHKHGDLGEQIGPNLTGMAVHPKAELLVHILDPSRSVEGNYRLYTVVTTEGRVLSGMLAAETRTSIELIDTEAKRTTLPREDIEELLASPKSVMPEGFEKQMTREELRDLLEFLTNKGKYLPIDLSKLATVVSTKPMFYGQSPVERLVFPDWKPKVVDGVPYLLVDPQGDRVPNAIMLHGPLGSIPPRMPRQVEFPVNGAVGQIHMLGGIGGWSFPAHRPQSTSVIVRLHFEDGQTEEIPLKNGVHFADYIRRIDVPGSQFAFDLNGQQVRSLTIAPQRTDAVVTRIELVKGEDQTAPIVLAITLESP